MSKLPNIPEFAENIHDMNAALRAVKLSLEILAGLRQGESKGAPQVFVQGTVPATTSSTTYKAGDIWINNTNDQMYYWNGTNWRPVA